MIKIISKLQDNEMIVTQGAYENLYKSLGYTIVGEEVKKEVLTPAPIVEKEEEIEEEKPVKSEEIEEEEEVKFTASRKKK